MTERFQLTLHQGPLPPPDQLQAYETLMPGAVRSIFRLTESQVAHRQSIERVTVEGDARRAAFGMTLGFLLSAAILGVALLLGLAGHDHVAGLLVVTDLAGIAGSFVYATHTRRAERLERARLMLGNPSPPEQPS